MLKTSVIGVGNAGGNIAKLVHEEAAFPAIVVNTSTQDLGAIGDSIPVLLFGTGRGIGKSRDASKEELRKAIEPLISNEKMTQVLNGADLIFVVSSCGGGTGSGSSIILATLLSLSYPKAIVIPVGIAPCIDEGYGSQYNFVDYYADLKTKAALMPYMIYDNNQYSHLPYTQMIEKVNSQICLDIQVLSGMFNNQTNLNSIDDKDMETILRNMSKEGKPHGGRIVVATAIDIKERDIESGADVEKLLTDNLKNSATAELQINGRVGYMGVIANISDRVPFNPAIPSIVEYTGKPIDLFPHISINSDKSLSNNFYLIMSGLSMPRNRKDRSYEIVKSTDEYWMNIDDDDNSEDADLTNFRKKKSVEKKDDVRKEPVTYDDIFKSFGM